MKTNDEINKWFCEEVFGKCWHDIIETRITDGDHIPIIYDGFICIICGEEFENKFLNPNYFKDWNGFGIIWEWAIRQDWWNAYLERIFWPGKTKIYINTFINYKTFARDVYRFLEGKKWKKTKQEIY